MDSISYHVLIVDDSEVIRKILVALFSKHGHLCETAKDGLEALDKIEKNRYDAVITDFEMPRMNGILLTKALLRKNPHLPILVMTGFTRDYKIGTAMGIGARDFIKKPFSSDELIMRFKVMMHGQKIRAKLMEDKEMNCVGLIDGFPTEEKAPGITASRGTPIKT